MPVSDRCPLVRFATLAAAAAGAAVLAACGSAPVAPEPDRRPDTRPGGYYQDDGPHASPPGDLDQVADAVPREEPLHRYANRPYTVMGQTFTPATELTPFRQRGRASWYGRKFHGKPTASGEPYDMYKMTAAHPTLPIPSYARVTRLANGRSVVVRINDRGPFLRGRAIDLSYTAAHKLGYVGDGSAEVEIEAIVPGEVAMIAPERPVPPLRRPGVPVAEPAAVSVAEAPQVVPIDALAAVVEAAEVPPAPETAAGAGPVPQAYLQLGAFASRANAEDFMAMVANELKLAPERLQIVPDGLRFRLRLGPYATVEAARAEAEPVGATLKIKPFVVAR